MPEPVDNSGTILALKCGNFPQDFPARVWYDTGMELGILWLVVVVVSAGVTGPLLMSWGMRLKSLDLERRVRRLEDNKLADSQREKAQKRWDQKKFEEEAILAGKANNDTGQWWERRV